MTNYVKKWNEEKLPELLRKKNGENIAMVDILKEETKFYEENERPEAEKRMQEAMDRVNNATTVEEQEVLMTAFEGEIMLQHLKYRTPLVSDSPGRLTFKMLIADYYENIVYVQGKKSLKNLHGVVKLSPDVVRSLQAHLKRAKERFEEKLEEMKES